MSVHYTTGNDVEMELWHIWKVDVRAVSWVLPPTGWRAMVPVASWDIEVGENEMSW